MVFRVRQGLKLLLGLCLLASCWGCQAAALQFCDRSPGLTLEQKDLLLRFAAVVKGQLGGSGQALALISRSGLDLSHFDVRYSHAGVSWQQRDPGQWAVRQLYYACDESRPRIFDEGLAGFVMGTHDPGQGYVSLVFLPPEIEPLLLQASQDKSVALGLLAQRYSANAYPYSLRYQNCNQWVLELLAAALGQLSDPDRLREQAQQWLQTQGYQPSVFQMSFAPVIWFSPLIPWIHSSDHPAQDLVQLRYQVSMPASLEAFVHALLPAAKRIEICHRGRQVVVHQGWDPVAQGCLPGAEDAVFVLD